MIALLPYCNQEGSIPNERDLARNPGLAKLIDDLRLNNPDESHALPDSLKHTLFQRISREPARVETDLNGKIVATNPAFSALCGYSFSEIRGKKPGSFLQGQETDSRDVDRIRTAIKNNESVSVELTNYHKNGLPYRVHISIEPLFDDSGNPIGYIATETQC